MTGGLQTTATLLVAACALFAAACDDGEPAAGIETRATFVIAAPIERFRHLSAEITYPEFAKPVGGSSPECNVSRYFEHVSLDASTEGLMSVELDAYDVFPPTQGLPPRTHDDEPDDDAPDDDEAEDGAIAASAQTVGEVGFDFRVLRCAWSAKRALEAEDFAVEVVEATDASGSNLTATPELRATSVFSEFEVPSDAEPTYRFDVYIAVANDAGPLGALQFDIVFLGNDGGWFGAGGSTRCSSLGGGSELSTFNDKGGGLLSGAIVDLEGIETPGEVARCTFGMDMPVLPEYFAVDVVDFADVEGNPPPEDPIMEVARIVLLNPDNVRTD